LGNILVAVHRIVAIIGAKLAAAQMMTPFKTVMIKWQLEDDK
jgi:hypothetical protein